MYHIYDKYEKYELSNHTMDLKTEAQNFAVSPE